MTNDAVIEFGVIGTGPMAAAAVEQILKFTSDILVFDIAEDGSDFEKKTRKTLGLLKSYQGKYFPYQLDNRFFSSTESIPTWLPSKSLGGYSLVWGATLSSESDIPGVMDNFDANGVEFLGRNFKSPFQSFSKPQRLAVAKELCIRCGQCLYGCSNKAIWNSKDFFLNLEASGKIKIVREKVAPIQKSGDNWRLYSNSYFHEVKNLVLCAGTLGNLEILAKSELIDGNVGFSENLMYYGLLLHRKKFVTEDKFSLSTSFVSTEINEEKTRIQLYEDLRGLQFRLRKFRWRQSKALARFYSLANLFFTPFIGYLPQELSPRITVTLNVSSAEIMASEKLNYRLKLAYLLQIFKYFSHFGVFLVGMRFSKSGSGYHVGNIHGSEVANCIRETSTIPGQKNLLIFDPGILNHLEPGPITVDSIAVMAKRLSLYLRKSFTP